MKGDVVAISWTMPPTVTPRSIQVARTLEGLRLMGWDSTVVTQSPADHMALTHDETLARWFAESYGQISIRLSATTLFGWVVEPSSWSPRRFFVRLQHRFFQVVNLLFLVPYLCNALPKSWIHHPGWYWSSSAWLEVKWRDRAVRQARRLIKSSPRPVLLTFGQPWVDHEIGLRVRRHCEVPWIAHFSDPWTDNPFLIEEKTLDLDRQRRLERLTVERADALVFVTQETADLVMRKYPAGLRRKVHVIPHSLPADCEKFVSEESPRDVHSQMTISLLHAGNLYGARQAFHLIDAVASLRHSGQLPTDFSLKLVGSCDRIDELVKYLQDADIPTDVIILSASVGWLKSRREMERAQALVLIEAPMLSSPFLPSKLLEYLAANKPILGITPQDSPSGRLLQQLGFPVADPSDPRDIATGILEILHTVRNFPSSDPVGEQAALSPYSNAKVAGDWDRLLSSLRT